MRRVRTSSRRKTAVREWLDASRTPRGQRTLVACLVVGIVLLITRDQIVLPFRIGWTNSRDLVMKEGELARLRQQVYEYQMAAAFLRTDEGKKLAGRLMYEPVPPGERSVILKPAPREDKLTTRKRLAEWILAREDACLKWVHMQGRILKRWAVDPPEDPTAPPTTPRPVDETLRDAAQAGKQQGHDAETPRTDKDAKPGAH